MTPLEQLLGLSPRGRPRPLLFLAPMAGITDAPFRRLARRCGADVTVSEMVASQAMIRHTAKSLKIASSTGVEEPFVVQLAGADPAAMAEAARLNVALGAHAIDINMGCPVKKIVKSGSGAALLRDPALAEQIVAAVVAAVPVPVSVKLRLGWDHDHLTGLEVARRAQGAGARWITVHGRTRAQMYGGRADWGAIAGFKSALTVPVIGNGDVRAPEDARRMAEQTGVDGIMIGRAALGAPWLFGRVRDLLEQGDPGDEPDLEGRFAFMLEHYHGLLEHHGPRVGHRAARKHLAWYSRTLPGGARFREEVNHAPDAEITLELLERFREEVRARQRAA